MDTLDKYIKNAAISFIGLIVFAGIILIYNTCSDKKIVSSNQTTNQCTTIDSTVFNSTTSISYDADKHSSMKSDSSSTEKKSFSTSENISNDSGFLDSIVFNLTLAVNSINNILSSSALALGILTLFLALIGLFGYKTIKEDITNRIEGLKVKIQQDGTKSKIKLSKGLRQINKLTNQTSNSVSELDNRINIKTVEYNNIIEALKHSISEQNRFSRQVNNYLYGITYDIAENHIQDDNESKRLLDKLDHERYIANLYLYDADQKVYESLYKDKVTALEKLEVLFELNDFQHLQFVANNDFDQRIRELAKRVIHHIYASHIEIIYNKKSKILDLERAIKLLDYIGKPENIVHLKIVSHHKSRKIRELVKATIDSINQKEKTDSNNSDLIPNIADWSVIDGL